MAEPQQLPLNDKTHMVFMTMIDMEGQLFTDQIERDFDANHIKSYPIKSCHRMKLLHAYSVVYLYLCIRGCHPQLHKLDNKSSHDVEAFITKNNASFQNTPPVIHQTNIAKQAIHTWKNNFVTMCASAAKSYRLSNKCKDQEQTDITLNICAHAPKTQTSLLMKPLKECFCSIPHQWHQLELNA
ncbi:hypothetical protein ACHAW6_008153 [Cyclotella cf. meneghiniana]